MVKVAVENGNVFISDLGQGRVLVEDEEYTSASHFVNKMSDLINKEFGKQTIRNVIEPHIKEVGNQQKYRPKLSDPFTVNQQKAHKLYQIIDMDNDGRLRARGPLDLNIKQVLIVQTRIVDKMHRPGGITNRQVKKITNKHLKGKDNQPWDTEKVQRVVYNIEHRVFDQYIEEWEQRQQEILC